MMAPEHTWPALQAQARSRSLQRALPLRQDAPLPVDGVLRSRIWDDEPRGALRQVRGEQHEEEVLVGLHHDGPVRVPTGKTLELRALLLLCLDVGGQVVIHGH